MRKFIILISIFVFSLTYASTISAQSDDNYDYARAYQDYIFTQDVYTGELSEYRLARSQYLQAKTLVSESKARDATVDMLEARDDVIIKYLVAIRFRLNETDGVSEALKAALSDRIDAEIAWFTAHKSRISSAGTLEDLVDDSNEAATKFADTEKVVYEALIEISSGKIEVLRNQLSANLSDLQNKVFEIDSNGDYDVGFSQRWFAEIQNKITRSLDKTIEANTFIEAIYDTKNTNLRDSSRRLEIYNEAISKINEAYLLLREGNNFMKEVMRGIKA